VIPFVGQLGGLLGNLLLHTLKRGGGVVGGAGAGYIASICSNKKRSGVVPGVYEWRNPKFLDAIRRILIGRSHKGYGVALRNELNEL